MEKTDCTYSVFKLLKSLSALIFFIGTNTTDAQIFDTVTPLCQKQ